MTDKAPVPRFRLSIELVVATVLGLLALGSFALQALTMRDGTSTTETALFNALQFLLTVGFGWYSTRAISRVEFEASLKRFAVSAYRRATDIEDMMRRLKARLAGLRDTRTASGQECDDLDLVTAVMDDSMQVVRSSIADWADVIGQEMLAVESVRRLEEEKRQITENAISQTDAAALKAQIAEIDNRIASVVATLPTGLQFDLHRDDDSEIAREHAIEWIRRSHEDGDGLELRVVAGAEYTAERDPDTLVQGDTLYSQKGPDRGLNTVDSEGKLVGRILNNSPLSYDKFVDALVGCYGTDRITLRFEEVYGRRTTKGETLKWYSVRVASQPRRRPRRR